MQMDRINKFLEKRPVKHTKVIAYNDKKYKVTKEDLKMVRMYRGRKCLDKAFKPGSSTAVPFAAGPAMEPLARKTVRTEEQSDRLLRRTREYYKRHPRREKRGLDKNVIHDLWADDNMETVREYRQEWVYSVKEAYDRPVESLRLEEAHLREEVRRVYMKHFRPREVKSKSLSDLLPRLPDASEMRPFPTEAAAEWRLPGDKRLYCGRLLVSIVANELEMTDIQTGKSILKVVSDGPIAQACASSSATVIFRTDRKVFTVVEGVVSEILDMGANIRDICLDGDTIAILAGKTVRVYDLQGLFIKKFVADHEKPNRVKIYQGRVLLSTANGLMIEAATEGDIRTLNYVIDFDIDRNGKILLINNLNRLIVLNEQHRTEKNIIQHEIAREIRAHRILNMIAIVFHDEIGIYKAVNGEYIPVHTLPGRFRSVEWHPEMPWLYACKSSRVVLYT